MTQKSPYTVWLVVAVVATVLGALLAVGQRDLWLVVGGLVLVVACVGLVVGVWPAWLFLTVVAAGDLLASLFTGSAPWTLLVNAVLLVLLLARPTQRHVARWRPAWRG